MAYYNKENARAKYKEWVETMLEKASKTEESKPNTLDNVDKTKLRKVVKEITGMDMD
ncbi:MAG: hypothetical protein WC413_00815 [Candidatus Nanoarchaeia archaeon]